jgi:antirestriction protein ArdC
MRQPLPTVQQEIPSRNEGYAKEELVAEPGPAFLCADLEITPEIREHHAAYIGHWLKALRDDKRLIFSAVAPAAA